MEVVGALMIAALVVVGAVLLALYVASGGLEA
jgi:hypothetical protein